MLFDQVIGARCVRQIRVAWVGNVITVSGYNFRRGVETGDLKIEDHTNLTFAMALRAGAINVLFYIASKMRFQTGPAEWEISIFSLDKIGCSCNIAFIVFGK